MTTQSKDNPGVIAFPPLIFAGLVTIGAVAHFVHPVRLLPPWPARIAGAVLVCLAGAFALWAERVFHAAGTNVRPDRPTTAIVESGPFRYTRNPMYVSLCLLLIGIALLIDGWTPLLCLPPMALLLHFGVIRREEKSLAAKFGEPYLAINAACDAGCEILATDHTDGHGFIGCSGCHRTRRLTARR